MWISNRILCEWIKRGKIMPFIGNYIIMLWSIYIGMSCFGDLHMVVSG